MVKTLEQLDELEFTVLKNGITVVELELDGELYEVKIGMIITAVRDGEQQDPVTGMPILVVTTSGTTHVQRKGQ